MYKKNIKYLATISLKYFFDFDYSVFDYIFLVITSHINTVKIITTQIGNEFYDGIFTIAQDAREIKIALENNIRAI